MRAPSAELTAHVAEIEPVRALFAERRGPRDLERPIARKVRADLREIIGQARFDAARDRRFGPVVARHDGPIDQLPERERHRRHEYGFEKKPQRDDCRLAPVRTQPADGVGNEACERADLHRRVSEPAAGNRTGVRRCLRSWL